MSKASMRPIVLAPAEGRAYGMGRIGAEWWLEPHTTGPGALKGSFVLVPGGVTHDFENRSAHRAGVLNLSIPGNFEENMPAIVQRFAEHPPGTTANKARSD